MAGRGVPCGSSVRFGSCCGKDFSGGIFRGDAWVIFIFVTFSLLTSLIETSSDRWRLRVFLDHKKGKGGMSDGPRRKQNMDKKRQKTDII